MSVPLGSVQTKFVDIIQMIISVIGLILTLEYISHYLVMDYACEIPSGPIVNHVKKKVNIIIMLWIKVLRPFIL